MVEIIVIIGILILYSYFHNPDEKTTQKTDEEKMAEMTGAALGLMYAKAEKERKNRPPVITNGILVYKGCSRIEVRPVCKKCGNPAGKDGIISIAPIGNKGTKVCTCSKCKTVFEVIVEL